LAPAHANLGNSLRTRGRLDEAIAACRQAICLDPDFAEAYCHLGLALGTQGHFPDALAALQRGHQLGQTTPGWSYPSADWVRECQRLLDLDRRLPGILRGEDRSASAAERVTLAQLCRLYKHRYAAAARLYAEAFAGQPLLAEDLRAGHRYHAACAAALAAAGQGSDRAGVGDAERAAFRRYALTWLRADLAAWARVGQGSPQTRQSVIQALRHWLNNPDLAGLRDPQQIGRLPAEEQPACRRLWADVAALLRQAEAEQ
jgi:serine/threonine-protein kinase